MDSRRCFRTKWRSWRRGVRSVGESRRGREAWQGTGHSTRRGLVRGATAEFRARAFVSVADRRRWDGVGYALTAVTRSPACPFFVPHIRRVRTSNLTQLALLGVVEPWAVRRLPLTAGHCTRDPQDCARAAVRWLRQRFRCTRSLCVVTAPRLVRPHAAFLTTCGVVLLRRIESAVTSSRATGQLLLRRVARSLRIPRHPSARGQWEQVVIACKGCSDTASSASLG